MSKCFCGKKAAFKVFITESNKRNLCYHHYDHWSKYGKDTAIFVEHLKI